MKIFRSISFGVFLSVISILLWGQKASASTIQSQTGDYVVEFISPHEQVKAVPYYDVRYQPGTEHTIQAKITNLKSKTITVHQKLNSTITNDNGNFGTSTNKKDFDPSMKYPFSEIARLDEGQEAIQLGAFENKTVTAHIKAPTQDFKGIIHGEWSFIVYSKAITGVGANYAYSLGVQMRGSSMNVSPNLVYKETKPIQISGFPYMAITLRNTKAMYLGKVTVKAKITRNGVLKSTHDKYQTGIKIAPNSSYRIPIAWNYNKLKPGNYDVDVQIAGTNFYNKLPLSWHFKEKFKVTSDDVKIINKERFKKPVGKEAFVAGFSGIILIVLLFVLFYVKKYV